MGGKSSTRAFCQERPKYASLGVFQLATMPDRFRRLTGLHPSQIPVSMVLAGSAMLLALTNVEVAGLGG